MHSSSSIAAIKTLLLAVLAALLGIFIRLGSHAIIILRPQATQQV